MTQKRLFSPLNLCQLSDSISPILQLFPGDLFCLTCPSKPSQNVQTSLRQLPGSGSNPEAVWQQHKLLHHSAALKIAAFTVAITFKWNSYCSKTFRQPSNSHLSNTLVKHSSTLIKYSNTFIQPSNSHYSVVQHSYSIHEHWYAIQSYLYNILAEVCCLHLHNIQHTFFQTSTTSS